MTIGPTIVIYYDGIAAATPRACAGTVDRELADAILAAKGITDPEAKQHSSAAFRWQLCQSCGCWPGLTRG